MGHGGRLTADARKHLVSLIFEYADAHPASSQNDRVCVIGGHKYLDMFTLVALCLENEPEPWFVVAVLVWCSALDSLGFMSMESAQQMRDAAMAAAQRRPYLEWTDEEVLFGLSSECPEIRQGMMIVVSERRAWQKTN